MCKMTISDFYCTECGKKGMSLPRKHNQQRESGHLKKIFCVNCKREVNHAEVRPSGGYTCRDFMLEYQLGRFVDGNREPISNLLSCSEDCLYNINGKCWNSKGDYKCSKRLGEEE